LNFRILAAVALRAFSRTALSFLGDLDLPPRAPKSLAIVETVASTVFIGVKAYQSGLDLAIFIFGFFSILFAPLNTAPALAGASAAAFAGADAPFICLWICLFVCTEDTPR
jgi:hypothetical protein